MALRPHLSALLDQVLGWTVDFGDVQEIFNPVFKMLDHKPPQETSDLDDCCYVRRSLGSATPLRPSFI